MQSTNKVNIHLYVLWATYNFWLMFTSTAELSKHKRYEIRMSVYNAVGEGPTSPPQEVFVGEAGMYTSCQLCQHCLIQQPLLTSSVQSVLLQRLVFRCNMSSVLHWIVGAVWLPALTLPVLTDKQQTCSKCLLLLASNSAYSPTPECGHSGCHSHPAGRDLGPSPCGCAEWRHPGLQGQIHTFLQLPSKHSQVP